MHHKANNKESKTYVQGLRQFGNTLPRGIKDILKKNGYNYYEIISKWNKLVGKNISDIANPKSIKIKKGDTSGSLILSIKRGDEINIEYSKNEIINKINSYFGYKFIDKILINVANAESKKIKKSTNSNKSSKNFNEQISKIKNTNIKDSLSELLKVFNND